MAITASVADVVLRGISPISFSRKHDTPKIEGEKNDMAYELRTWPNKMHVDRKTGMVVYPAFGLHQAIYQAARRSGDKIAGQGNTRWAGKFEAGITMFDDPTFGVTPDTVQNITISCNSDGVRGSGKRVDRIFPIIHDWSLTTTIHVIEPQITKAVFEKYLAQAGIFVGLGRFAPRVGGTNGRFVVESFVWEDNRRITA